MDRNNKKPASRKGWSIPLEIIISCLKQMEDLLLGLNQLRSYVGTEIGSRMLATLIEEAEAKISEIRRQITQC